MERTPLLRHPANGRRYSQIPSNDEHSEYSVYSYCGDNFPRPEKRSSRSGTVDTQISITSDELPPNLPRRYHRPFFITVVTIVHCALIIYICVVGGIEDISFSPFVMSESVNTFGFIANNNNDSVHKEKVSRYSGVNGFIGPNSSFLVTVGAKFGPCMKKLEVIENRVKSIEKNESDFVCCSFNGECGMMKNASCPGVVIDSENCTSNSVNCTRGITLRPCCLGLYCQCQVISQSKCSFQRGHWHKDKLLCKDVNCLDGICGMYKVKDKTSGHQWYRLITPIFLHLGVIHLVTNLFFQIPVGILIEREIGTVRTCLIYLISGIGGNLFCGLFNPLSPQVGASGALFGLIGLLIVKLLQLRHDVRRPCCEVLCLLSVALISFALGTLPYIGNFVHIGGFLFGLFASLALLPRTNYRCRNLAVNSCVKAIFTTLLLILLVGMCVAFFLVKNPRTFCSWCHYVDCVPYKKDHFCPSMNSDGFLDNGT
ncbi:unnamed protein product [Porites lobata]|uniref:Peptidase S54 rhomboid domain-containing protein n=1 Tax=Porites lobata TaxID=104759 RepID=A0ABN8PSR4_9CNID|nr:unnamed protein product [Porites lobata]